MERPDAPHDDNNNSRGEFRAPHRVERSRPPQRPPPTAPDARRQRRNSVDAPATTPDWRERGPASPSGGGAHHSAARRVSTPAAHAHAPRAPSAASVTAAAAGVDDGAATTAGGVHPARVGGALHAYPPASPRLTSQQQQALARSLPRRAPATMPDAAATSAEDEGEQMCVRALEEAQARIVAEREEIARIEVLLTDINEMRAGGGPDAEAFDDEDVREVEAEIAARQRVLKAMEVDLAARIDKYETEVSVVANAIRKRASVLKTAEQRTRVLTENPRLMTFFAHKQRDLIEIRKNLYDALAQEAPSAATPS
nr:type I hlyD superfamily incomplete domain containing protein [Pandoravirus belohorizontensis]